MQEIKLHNNICEDFLFAPENFWDLIDAHLPIVTWLTKKYLYLYERRVRHGF